MVKITQLRLTGISERNSKVSILAGSEETSLQAIVKRPPVPLWSWKLSTHLAVKYEDWMYTKRLFIYCTVSVHNPWIPQQESLLLNKGNNQVGVYSKHSTEITASMEDGSEQGSEQDVRK
ncbi:hypothetical protein GDO78_015595 [Eleutherodactylus coqui]|uniref:Uncharacterized protein n=1 Tax=Eleutherodactylus coqui TaxID=57060 RepID=A0A8J6EPX4_ELECQ|nr:hypothetical protein GDO78_015595 [Eleutherodactylus coqui]